MICPECGREKATCADDAMKGYCPKWWAIMDKEAEVDCNGVADALRECKPKNLCEIVAYQKGVLDGANKQRQNTAASVFSYIIDHGEIIAEEECQIMLCDFLNNKNYNKIDISQK